MKKKVEVCEYKWLFLDLYTTSCIKLFVYNRIYNHKSNKIKFCPFCGKKIKEVS